MADPADSSTGSLTVVDFSPSAIAAEKRAINDLLRDYDAIQTLAAIVGFSSVGAAETYSEPNSAPSARMEYLATVLLERADGRGRRVMTVAETERASAAIQTALDYSQLIAGQTTFSLLSRAESEDPVRVIGAHLQLVDAAIRGPGYEYQAKQFLRAAFAGDDVQAALRYELGFDAAAALVLEEAASDALQKRFDAALEFCRQISAHPQELVFQMHRRAEHILCFRPEELAAEAGRPIEEVEAFLRAFSIEFGGTRGTHLLTDVVRIRRRPIVASGDGRFLWTSPLNLLWALGIALEEALKDRPEWELYQDRRSKVVEEIGVLELGKALRADAVWTNLRFTVNGGDEHEIDGVLVVDDVCFVIEAKAGRMSARARRGRKRELLPALEALVGRSSSQASRLTSAIFLHDEVRFSDHTGAAVEVNLASISRVEPIVVTLEDVSWLGRHQQELHTLGLLDRDAPVPWIVSAFDLETICKTIEFPAQLTLYLEARRRLPPRLIAGDELDIWMVHLLKKLDFADKEVALLWGDWSEKLDRYFMFGHGELPRMPLNSKVRTRIADDDRSRRPGHLTRTERLIEKDQETRRLEPSQIHNPAKMLADKAFGPRRGSLEGIRRSSSAS